VLVALSESAEHEVKDDIPIVRAKRVMINFFISSVFYLVVVVLLIKTKKTD
jgi:hypothetical protein